MLENEPREILDESDKKAVLMVCQLVLGAENFPVDQKEKDVISAALEVDSVGIVLVDMDTYFNVCVTRQREAVAHFSFVLSMPVPAMPGLKRAYELALPLSIDDHIAKGKDLIQKLEQAKEERSI